MRKILALIITAVLLTSCSNANKPAKRLLKEDNVHPVSENETEQQSIFNDTDSDSIVVKGEGVIIFVLNERYGRSTRKKIMKLNIKDLSESVLTDQKPFEDAMIGSHNIFTINSPTLSLDGKYLLFVTEKYATGSQLVKVNIKTGKWTELFTAEWFEEIDIDPYKGYFLAGQSDIEQDRGRYIYYRLLNSSGRIIKKFSDAESMIQFRDGLK